MKVTTNTCISRKNKYQAIIQSKDLKSIKDLITADANATYTFEDVQKITWKAHLQRRYGNTSEGFSEIITVHLKSICGKMGVWCFLRDL
tara:strand:+ start:66 stop:332 length:267 start_codon:yes stop_codon:yes gene_type:complete